MTTDSRPNLDEYSSRLIKYKARKLVDRFNYSKTDREDLEQELTLHVIQRMDQFDPRRSSQNTFVNRIVNRRIISILRQRVAQRRDFRRCVSLTEVSAEKEEDQFEPVDLRRTRVDPPSDLAIDLADAIKNLHDDTRAVCVMLNNESISEIARRLVLTRGRVRSQIAVARKLLTEKGIDVYL